MSQTPTVSAEIVNKPLPTIDQVREAFKSIPDINSLVNLSKPTTSQDISDVLISEGGEAEGVHITFPLNPTVSAVYCGEKTGGAVALFVFPGDDTTITTAVVLALAKAMHALDLEVILADSFAPVFHEGGGVSFSPDRQDVINAMIMKYEGALGHLTAIQAQAEGAQPQILVPEKKEIIIPG